MTTLLTLSTQRRPDGTPVVTAVGEVDMSNAGIFRDALIRASSPDGRLVVDLTGVEYLDSAGLTVLFTHAAHLELIATPLLAPVLTISGLADIMTMHGLDASAGGDTL
jgi:anti-sigma B factor antagonist